MRTDAPSGPIARIVEFSVARHWLVLFATAIAAIIGAVTLTRLPIDAVPDITNNQVQINVAAPALSPLDVERQITFPLETALAGIPGLESTRSLTRHGFAQITAVFTDETDLYFARQQVADRLRGVEDDLPAGIDADLGPVATGLGDIYMWTVEFSGEAVPGQPGVQADGSYLTPEGTLLRTEKEQAAYLRTIQDWIVAPQLKTVPVAADRKLTHK